MLTDTREDYLKAIYLISKKKDAKGVRVSDIAKELKVARASAFKMIMQLAELGYVKKDKYALIYLTPEGVSKAETLFQRYDIIKNFLVMHLKFNEDEADEEASALEHVLSDRILGRMRYCVFYLKQGFMSDKINPFKDI